MKLVLVLTWHEGDLARSQAYGTWEAREDGSHHAEIAAFMKARLADRRFASAMLYALEPVDV